MLSLFSCASWPSICFLEKCVCRYSAHCWLGCFFFFMLSCMSNFYILEINPMSVASCANIFPHSIGCLLVWFMVSFAVQKLLSLITSHLFIFLLVSITLGDESTKILLWFMWKSVLFMFSSRRSILLSLMFRSLINFEFISAWY